MTRQLLLMRHAKSDWKEVGLGDKERPLNSRGRATAPMMANWVFEHDYLPNLVICSGAIRTQQTLELMLQRWTTIQTSESLVLPHVIIDDSMYLASEAHILSIAESGATGNESGKCIMMLGHNPGMEELASKLHGCDVVMPTGAIAILLPASSEGEWPDDWQDAKMWKWRGLVKPKELGTEKN